jgi:outer membrane protein
LGIYPWQFFLNKACNVLLFSQKPRLKWGQAPMPCLRPSGGKMPYRKTLAMTVTALVLLTIALPMGYCAEVVKLGTVNFQRIFENSTAGKVVKEQINSEGRRMEQDLKQNGDQIKALEKRLEQDAGIMSKQAREEQRWELERKISDVQALKKKYDRSIQELQVQLVNEVRQGVLAVIQEYGKKEGYLMIVEDISVVYTPENLDVTDEIVKRYNASYAKQGKKNQGPKQ